MRASYLWLGVVYFCLHTTAFTQESIEFLHIDLIKQADLIDKTTDRTMISTPDEAESKRTNIFAYSNLNLVAPLPTLVALLCLWWWLGIRKSEKNLVAELICEPPAELSPASCTFILHGKIEHKAFIALIPYWGHLGFLSMRSLAQKSGPLYDDLYLEKHGDLPSDFPNYQHLAFSQLFKKGDVVLLSVAGEHFSFYETAKSLREYAQSNLNLYDGKYLKIFKSHWFITLGFIAVLFAAFIINYQLGVLSALSWGFLSAIVFWIYCSRPRLSCSGLQVYRSVVGFHKFLALENQELLDQQYEADQNYFDRIYPFVMAFGLEKRLAQIHQRWREESPSWLFDDRHQTHQYKTLLASFSSRFTPQIVNNTFRRSAKS